MSQTTTETMDGSSDVGARYATAAALLEKWMLEESGYDDRVWPVIEQELQQGGLQCRDVDEPGA
jgi:hypothetical protein